MIAVWNRRELITLVSMQKFYRVREALANAGIPSAVKTRGASSAAGRARRGMGGLNQDALYTFTVYVLKTDFDRAVPVLRDALRAD